VYPLYSRLFDVLGRDTLGPYAFVLCTFVVVEFRHLINTHYTTCDGFDVVYGTDRL